MMSMKTKTIAGALAALAIVTSTATLSTQAQAGWKGGLGLGIGIAAGALIASGAYAHGYYGPGYVYEPAYGCRFVERVNAYGHVRLVKVCGPIY
jgi:hypothetical protein